MLRVNNLNFNRNKMKIIFEFFTVFSSTPSFVHLRFSQIYIVTHINKKKRRTFSGNAGTASSMLVQGQCQAYSSLWLYVVGTKSRGSVYKFHSEQCAKLGCLSITGAMRSPSKAGSEVLLFLTQLNLYVMQEVKLCGRGF